MPRRTIVFASIAVAAAALFVRLGFWQLHRLGERRQRNALVQQRLVAPPVDILSLPNDTAVARFRRASVTGTPDYAHELVLVLRSHQGSPGVNLVTPIRRPGSDTAVLVNRGWAYAPDGIRVDESRWHENDTTFTGYVEVVSGRSASGELRGNPRLVRDLDRAAIARAIPYPVTTLYLVATPGPEAAPGTSKPAAQDHLARLEPPPLDEGPHLGYAIQWFSFAAIALVGTAIVARKRA